jgi:predicted SAM-dependent methyltransferase
MTRKQKLVGRLRIVKQLARWNHGLSLDIGCKNVRLGAVNVDLDPVVRPDLVADVLHLPFRNESFSLVYFADVIEHLPSGEENTALSEIFRVLRKNGTLILTTPNDMRIYSILDPARYIVKHRHYKMRLLEKIVENSGFTLLNINVVAALLNASPRLNHSLKPKNT